MKSSSQSVEVDWVPCLPAGAVVTYSDLCTPDLRRKESDRNVAEIVLPSDHVIDVEWRSADDRYVVTLYKDDFEQPFDKTVCDDVDEVIATVATLAKADSLRNSSGASAGSGGEC